MKIELKQVLYPQPKSKIKASDGKSEGKYKFFTSSPMQTRFIDEANYDKPSLIFGTGGNASVHFRHLPIAWLCMEETKSNSSPYITTLKEISAF